MMNYRIIPRKMVLGGCEIPTYRSRDELELARFLLVLFLGLTG